MFSDSENEYDEQEHDQDSITRDEEDMSTEPHPSTDGAAAQVQVKREYDPKDPMRPRRKKARRACGACQRAHLTCSMCLCLISPPPKVTPPWLLRTEPRS